MLEIFLSEAQYFEFEKIAIGAFAPVNGFMTKQECDSVINHMRMPTGEIFPIPVVLDVEKSLENKLLRGSTIRLIYNKVDVGSMDVESVFTLDKNVFAEKVFGTCDILHPGVSQLFQMKDLCVGGKITAKPVEHKKNDNRLDLTPKETKALFEKLEWKTIAGFQTRNVPHRGHEYLQRTALELVDGLFIHPLIGRRKAGDYTANAIRLSYEAFISEFLPKKRVLLSFLTTTMRYAGPREALFHAIIRRNYGCTHFIIGRDHAGVGSFYGKYEAQELVRKYESELGINILYFKGPFFCRFCDTIVTEKTCAHYSRLSKEETDISGTEIRRMLVQAVQPDIRLMRPEVLESILGIELFIQEEK